MYIGPDDFVNQGLLQNQIILEHLHSEPCHHVFAVLPYYLGNLYPLYTSSPSTFSA